MDFSPQDYAFSKLIAIDCDVWATDTQAPVVLIGNDFPIGAAADGADLRFSDAAATAAVPHWIQQFDAAGRTAIVWLRPAAIPAVGADSLRMHWGNSIAPSASSYDAVFEKLTSVDARLLLHFDEAAGVPVDSSGNHFAVSSVGPAAWGSGDGGASGLDSAARFAVGSHRLYSAGQCDTVAGVLDEFPSDGCITLWLANRNTSSFTSGTPKTLVHKSNGAGNSISLACEYDSNDGWQLVLRVVSGGVSSCAKATRFALMTGSKWQHVVASWGSGGLSLWIDGVRYGHDDSTAVPAAAGEGAAPFTIGDSGGSDMDYLFAMDELAVYSFEAQRHHVLAWRQRRKPIALITQFDKLQRDGANPIIGSAAGSAGTLGPCQEPKVVKHPTLDELWMYYSSGGVESWDWVIRRATSADGLTWTDRGVAVAPAERDAGMFVGHHRVVIHDGIWYMFYTDMYVGCGLKTSADGIAWTEARTVQESDEGLINDLGFSVNSPYPLLLPYSWTHWPDSQFPDGFGNTWATAQNGRWQVLIEAGNPARGGAWDIGYFESPPFSDELTPAHAAYQLSLVAGPFATTLAPGVCGGPWALLSGGLWHLWYHSSTVDNSLPTNIAHAASADLKAWAADPFNPTLAIDGGRDIIPAQDQVADVTLIEWHGKLWAYFAAASNPVGASNINVATYDGSLGQFLAGPLRISFGGNAPPACMSLIGAGR